MGNCDVWLFGKESEIDKIGEICKLVGELLKTKYGLNKNGKFLDWTGISIFLICYSDLDRTLHEQKVKVFDESELAEEWGMFPWEEGQAAIWWPEIEWPHNVPTEVFQFMVQESRKLGVQQSVEKLLREWGVIDDGVFDLVEKEFRKKGCQVEYP